MKTQILEPDVIITTIKAGDEKKHLSGEELAETILDSIKEQIFLSNLFKEKFDLLINSIDFVHPGDSEKFEKAMDLFFESLDNISRENMKKILDMHIVFNPEKKKKSNNPFKSHPEWAQDWMEQMNFLRDESEILSMKNDHLEDFCYYVDVTDVN